MDEVFEEEKKEGVRIVTLYVPVTKLNVLDNEARGQNLSRSKYIMYLIDKHIEDLKCKKTA